jgi:ketosteroid isomerase-like protein
MDPESMVLENASVDETTPEQILHTALAGQGNIHKAADQFDDKFTFTDHALGLEFKDKGRLTVYLEKIRELFPDSERKAKAIFRTGERVVSEWTLTATKAEPFLFGRLRKVPICVRGISVVQLKDGKITDWSDYYDQLKSWRSGLAACFAVWIEP